MGKRLLLTAMAATALATAAFAGIRQAADPEEAVKAINTWYTDQLKQARDAMKNPDFQALMAERTKRAKDALATLDVTKVEPAKAYGLAQLYQMTGQHKELVEAASKYLTSNPPALQKYTAQLLMLGGYVNLRDAAAIQKLVPEVNPPDVRSAVSLAGSTAAAYSRVVAEKTGPQAALDLIKTAEAKVQYANVTGHIEQNLANGSIYQIAIARSGLYDQMGKKTEALTVLEEAKKRLITITPPEPQPGAPAFRPADYGRMLDSKINFAKLPGSSAPPVKQDRGYGDYKGLESLRGKVVVLDFTAHW
jgi:hypothetical protein